MDGVKESFLCGGLSPLPMCAGNRKLYMVMSKDNVALDRCCHLCSVLDENATCWLKIRNKWTERMEEEAEP